MKLEHGYFHSIIYRLIRYQWFVEAAILMYKDYADRVENKQYVIEKRILYYK